MSRIDNLVKSLCAGRVAHRRLGDVADLQRGTSITKKDVTFGDIPVVAGGRSAAYFHGQFNREGQTIVIAGSGAYAGFVSWWEEPIFVSDAFSVKADTTQLIPRYCFHWLSSQQNHLHSIKSGGGVPHIYAKDVKLLRIPVPPIEVQREIVRILDQFVELEAELKAELEARRQQYDHYAGLLLTSASNVPRAKLGDVAKVLRGASPRPIQKFITDDVSGAPWIRIGDVPADGKYITSTRQRVTPEGAAKSRRVFPGDFVLSNSMSFGRPYISKIDGYIHDGWLAISQFEESFGADYLYYLLRSAPVQEEFARRAGAGTVKNLNAEIVRSLEVPVPPLEQQARVVQLLDKFDALVNDPRVGLPAERASRRRQYEYYRDRLLSFEEAPA
jgi:type I restriction enzyme S subunit